MDLDKKMCPILDVEGVVACGTQFDLDIQLPDDNRAVIYGIIKNKYNDPIKDAVVKLVEIVYEHGKKERRPVSHTFTDKHGEFVFGPLCADRAYAIEIWVDRVRHYKICTVCSHDGGCLKGIDLDCDKPFPFPPKPGKEPDTIPCKPCRSEDTTENEEEK